MKKGREYDRHEIEVISKSAIGKSVNDILNEELITIEDENTLNKDILNKKVDLLFLGCGTYFNSIDKNSFQNLWLRNNIILFEQKI